MTIFSKRVQQIPPSGIRRFFDLVMAANDIISLGVGEPDFLTPWTIRDEAIYRIQKGATTYTANKGLLALRTAICAYVARHFNVTATPQECLITSGVSEAVDILMRTLIDPDDAVILPEPIYVCYRPLIELCGGVVTSIDTSQTAFTVTAAAIEAAITPKTKLIVLCSPNNPTGRSIPEAELQAIAQLAITHDLLIVSDDIYADLRFSPGSSIAAIPSVRDRVIYLNGFSKSHAMTGWRLGYMIAPEPIIDMANKIHQYAALCAPTIAQYAAIDACESADGDVARMRQSYKQRAQYFSHTMTELGLPTAMPDGGLYCFSSIQSLGMDAMTFAETLLAEQNVAIVPGHVFGAGGEGYIRSCVATDMNQLKQACAKIADFVRDHG